ncbi:GTP-binding protein [Streptomyces sp. TR02-1]|uniref:GTP-binding protein n=1 Tax=Streptomyces sp. TR02-1 TaxID=3385977 RepID=UPI0039A15B66
MVVAGGFGTGKTTLVRSVSEIEPLSTEALMTRASEPVDDLSGLEEKTATTVAFDFGRRTLTDLHVVLHLFGVPGQLRYWFTWPDLSRGAIGTIVMVDTRRLEASFHAVDYFEHVGVPYIVAVNQFDGPETWRGLDGIRFEHSHQAGTVTTGSQPTGPNWYDLNDVREALEVGPSVPLVRCDARDPVSSAHVLIALVRHHIALNTNSPATPTASTGALL